MPTLKHPVTGDVHVVEDANVDWLKRRGFEIVEEPKAKKADPKN